MTFFSIDVDELRPSLHVDFSLNQKNNTLTVEFASQPINGTLKISSHLNETIYSNSLENHINTISLDSFSKGIYAMEIASNNNRVLREFEIK
jgi:hypothetical protein